jgi:small subunit ribosomal protein S8
MTDTIADLLIRIKNAYLARKEEVSLPASKSKAAVAQVLMEAGYLTQVTQEKNDRGQENLILTLKYIDEMPAVTDVRRVSKPGCRIYVTAAKIPAVLHGYGVAILSTSQGIISDKQARQKGVGGELLGEVW